MLEKSLETHGKTTPELHLLQCLELLHHGDKVSAEKSLKTYTTLMTDLKAKAHPLFLIARSRLSADDNEQRALIDKFAEIYPDAVDKV